MKMNYVANTENKELVEKMLGAITWEKCDMLLTLNADAQKKQSGIISSDESTADEIKVATAKLEKLQKEEAILKEDQNKVTDAHTYVVETVKSASNDYTTNDEIAFRNVLRLSACDENGKFFKLAILTETAFGTFYDSMVSLHDMESDEINDSGLRDYSATAKESAKTAYDAIQNLTRQMFSVPVENDATKKITVKFNKADMNAIHECFVSGLNVDITKNKKTGTSTVDGMSFRYAIEKNVSKDGTVTYKGVRFRETLAKIAFVKLFK